jgi:hypothetical protein
MEIFELMKNIYCNKNYHWINDINEFEISPIIVHKWLSQNPKMLQYIRPIDKYVFHLEPKHYLLLLWALIPKQSSPPFIKFVKKLDGDIDIEELILRIRKHLELSDNDFEHSKKYIYEDINKNKIKYFKMFGLDKKSWEKAGLDFKEMKSGETRVGKKGLEMFF